LVFRSLIDGFDAEMSVLVLKGGVGIVEAAVYDPYDDALARLGLGQLLARTVNHLLGMGGFPADVGLV
jgi:hypothetical protein